MINNKKTVKLSAEINRFLKTHLNDGFTHGLVLKNAWEQIATERELKHTDNVVLSPKKDSLTVLIYVDSSHWAAELSAEKELKRLRLQKETGFKIDDLKFLVTRKTAFKKFFQKNREQKTADKEAQKTIPLTEEEERHARELVATIQDEKLREKLYKAMKADIEWKKGQKVPNLSQKPPESL